jgi:hypothetical protein
MREAVNQFYDDADSRGLNLAVNEDEFDRHEAQQDAAAKEWQASEFERMRAT